VAVARVIVGTDGRTETVTLLEAPDEAIGSAVGDAIKQWTFASIRGPAPESKPARASATLTLYFRIQNGKGLVFAARDMPGAVVPPRVPAPAPGAPPPAPPSVFRAETSARVVNQAELAMMVSSGSTIVVDVRDRDAFRRTHRDGALNIPRQELDVRGPIELRGAKNVVIDCTHETEGLCRLAARYLERVANVAIFIP
jgi:rhodanese-related sulfurtransferase